MNEELKEEVNAADTADTADGVDVLVDENDTGGDEGDVESTEKAEGGEDADEATEETVVSFGDEEGGEVAAADDTQWIKELRQRNRDQNKEISELKREREQYVQPAMALGPRPTLEDADYDAEVYEEQLTGWLEQKARIDNEAWQQENVQQEAATAWQGKLSAYENASSVFEKEAYVEAEDTVKMSLNAAQQSLMVHLLGAKLAPLIVGLGKNKTELSELAKIKDVPLFAAAIGRLESKMKVSKRKPTTQPEVRIAASGGGVTTDSTLDTLREKAAKTGNYTEVVAFKRRMKEQAA